MKTQYLPKLVLIGASRVLRIPVWRGWYITITWGTEPVVAKVNEMLAATEKDWLSLGPESHTLH
jgi:hypothetical protein